MSVTLIAWSEESYFWCTSCDRPIRYTEMSIWQNLARAYGAEVRLVPHKQGQLPTDLVGSVVVLDDKASEPLDLFVWPEGDVNIVTGRTLLDVSHLPGAHVVVPVPDTGVFGMCIAAIALEDRRRKLSHGSKY